MYLSIIHESKEKKKDEQILLALQFIRNQQISLEAKKNEETNLSNKHEKRK